MRSFVQGSRRAKAAAFVMAIGLIGSGLIGGIPTGSSAATATHGDVPQGGQPAQLTGPVKPADGAYPIAGAWGPSLKAAGYEQREYFASGSAFSYQATGPEDDAGTWKVAPAESAAYRTRIVVRMPTEASKFNGTVVVEWLNVSGGGDGAVDSVYLSPELERAGFAWVGISAQQVGIQNLQQKDPARYGSLTDPGDRFSYDIYTQAARALLVGGRSNPLAPLHVKRLLAVGESQSAIYLTTYIDAIQPLYQVFNGFLVHSRAGGAGAIPGASPSGSFGGVLRIRTDVGVPVLTMITQTDETFGGYYRARQPDTRFIRLWDVAGASHADSYIVTPGSLTSLGCSSVDEAPSHFVFEAALSAVNAWMQKGRPPPSAPRMRVKDQGGTLRVRTDTLGNASGGIQGPWEQVPVATYSNTTPPGSAGFCSLFGSTVPFSSSQLTSLYGSKSQYLKEYTKAMDRDIKAGYLLPADRAQVLSFAEQTHF
jgi:hypothetical protein